MKICVLGNSHVASLKNAWESTSICFDKSEVSVTFFAHRRDLMKGLVVTNDNVLKPDNAGLSQALFHTSCGLDHIDPDEYDMFFVYGCGLFINIFDVKKYTSAVLKATAIDAVKNSTSLHLCTELRSVTDKPIYVGHNPLRAKYKTELSSQLDDENYDRFIKLLQENVFDELNARLLSQPVDTILGGQYTYADYVSNSKRLDIGDEKSNQRHPERNRGHMNDVFGGRMWEQIREEIMNKSSSSF